MWLMLPESLWLKVQALVRYSGPQYSQLDICLFTLILKKPSTGLKVVLGSKVLHALFWNLHSLPFLPVSPLECKFQNKTGTESLTQSRIGPSVQGEIISDVKGSVCFVFEICTPSLFSPSILCGAIFKTKNALNFWHCFDIIDNFTPVYSVNVHI